MQNKIPHSSPLPSGSAPAALSLFFDQSHTTLEKHSISRLFYLFARFDLRLAMLLNDAKLPSISSIVSVVVCLTHLIVTSNGQRTMFLCISKVPKFGTRNSHERKVVRLILIDINCACTYAAWR
jgi:hypothetical protein